MTEVYVTFSVEIAACTMLLHIKESSLQVSNIVYTFMYDTFPVGPVDSMNSKPIGRIPSPKNTDPCLADIEILFCLLILSGGFVGFLAMDFSLQSFICPQKMKELV